eukprot:scaffold37957_cov67-Phaeocystis_antarctica.AAC.4
MVRSVVRVRLRVRGWCALGWCTLGWWDICAVSGWSRHALGVGAVVVRIVPDAALSVDSGVNLG